MTFQGLKDAHRQLLSKLITSAKATEEEFVAHCNKRSAAAAGGGGGAVVAGGGSGAVTTRGRSAHKSGLASARGGGGGGGGGLPSSTGLGMGLDFLNTSKGGGGGGYDVLMTPSFPPDELSMMLEVLNGFDTPRF